MINLFQPNINIDDAIKNYKKTLESGWLGRGNTTIKFEKAIAEFLNVNSDHVHCVSSCTSAIFEICSALDLGKNDTVLIPTNSFPSVPAAIMSTGAKLEVLDIDISTGNISIDELKKFCKINKPTAVFVTDYGGIPVNVSKLKKIVGSKCYILVDAAASLGTCYKYKNEFIHSEADFVCYSFDAMKLITCGEGGAAIIKNEEIMEKFKEYSYLGLPNKKKSGLDVAKGDNQSGWWEYDLKCLGRRSVMSDLASGLGLSQIAIIEDKLNTRRKIRDIYNDQLKNISDLKFLEQDSKNYKYSNYFCTVFTKKRDELAKYLLKNNVYSSFRYWPVHKMKIFKNGCIKRHYPNGNYFADNALNIPIHDALNIDEINEIINLIKLFYKN